jgi:hypothetical protein
VQRQRFLTRACLAGLSFVTLVAGCMIVQPLDDYPAASTSSGGSSGSSAGGSDAGGSSNAGKGGKNVGGAFGPCETNADCEPGSGSEPYMCSQATHRCTKLKTEVCPVADGNSFDPNAIVFGAFAPLTATNAERNPVVAAHHLALDELSGDVIGGLPDGVDDARRRLVMVVCYNQDDRIEDALDHLLGTLQVPAILATLKPGDLRRAYEGHPNNDVFFLSPVAVTAAVATLEDDDKVWNMLGQPSDYAPTYAALLKQTEKHLRAKRQLAAGAQIKVAVVTTPDAFDAELANKVTPLLSFNQGKSVKQNGDNYLLRSFGTTDPDEIAPIIDEIIEFRPDIVVSAASDVMTKINGVVEQVEARWEVLPDGYPLPTFILSPFNAGDLTRLRTYISSSVEASGEEQQQERYIGVGIAGPEDNSAQFEYESRLGALFGNVFADTANYYDATYLLAYAMYGAGIEEPLTGSSIARGMQRLLSGPALAIGPNTILSTFDVLRDPNASAEIRSTLGPPSFDSATGVRQIDGSVYCFNRNGTDVSVTIDSYRFDRTLGELRKSKRGAPFCIDDFFQ